MHIINNADAGRTHTKPLILDVPFHAGLTYRPLPNLLDQMCLIVRKSAQSSSSVDNINPDINLDFEEKFTVSRRCNF